MDRKQDMQGVHVLNGTVYSTATASTSVDLAKHDQVLFVLSITSIGVSTCTFTLQDSADNASFADTGHSFTQAAGAVNNTRWVWAAARDVRRYVRVRVAPGGGGTATLSGAAVLMGAVMPPESTTFSIDTTA